MPELPEVQTVVQALVAADLPGSRIHTVQVFWPGSVDRPAVHDFLNILTGLAIQRVSRRAKYIVLNLTRNWHLLIHLRMTGRLTLLTDPSQAAGPHDHVLLRLADGRQLRFTDTRKFGRFYLTRTPQDLLGKLGPEPLAPHFRVNTLRQQLQGRRGRLKPLLLNQRVIAGLGNIYADEALWEAGLHPCRQADSLSETEIRRLHRAIRRVLRRGLSHGGTSLGNGQPNFSSANQTPGQNQYHLRVFQQAGAPCRRCHQIIERRVVGQRSTFICPECQGEW